MKPLTVSALSAQLCKKELSSHELTQHCLFEIERTEPAHHAFLTVCAERALSHAKAIDQARMAGKSLHPLAGIPYSAKDNLCTQDVKTTCGSRMLSDFVPSYHATVCQRLEAYGCILIGKTNLDEFAMGSSCEHSAFGPTKNPHDITRTPGGSSGGSAACVASGAVPFSLGSDAGGSIRQPAAFCGTVGMRPTYGTVSRYGLIGFAPSFDQIGPMTQTVRDNAEILHAIQGYDRRDGNMKNKPYPDPRQCIGHNPAALRVGLLCVPNAAQVHPAIAASVRRAALTLEKLGCHIQEISLPSLAYALEAYHVLSSCEASSNLARFDGVRYGYRSENADTVSALYRNSRSEALGAEVKRRILLGSYALRAEQVGQYYNQAMRVRAKLRQEFSQAFAQCDILLSPTTPSLPPKLGEKTDDPIAMYQSDLYTVGQSLAHLPALSLPYGMHDGLPIGIQLTANTCREGILYAVAYALEQEEV